MTSYDSGRRQSAETETSCARSTISVYGTDRIGRGSMLFSGPDGLRPYRMKVDDEQRYVGIGTMSPEGTSEADYLWNSPKGMPHQRPRTAMVGEIGWGVTFAPDWRSLDSGQQIKLKDFRQECEQRATHKHFNQDEDVWYDGPRETATHYDDPYWIGSPSSADRCSRQPASSHAPKLSRPQHGRRKQSDHNSTGTASTLSR